MIRRGDTSAPIRPGDRTQFSTARRGPRVLIGLAALAVLVAGGGYAAARFAAGPAPVHPVGSHQSASSSPPRPRPPVRLPVGKIGSYAVAERSFVLVDRSRVRVAGVRVLHTLVRYPVIPAAATAGGARLARELFPLVVFAPGYLQCQASYSSLLTAWASAGYVVAGVDFPVTSCLARGSERDLVHQPGDVSYVIGQILQMSGQARGVLSGLVNPAQVAVAGHSDGGDTVAAMAGNTCCLDHRVKAAVILAGAESPWALGGSWFPRGTPPILFVQGDADDINYPSASQQMYRADTGTRFYLDLFGVGHLPPYEGRRPPEPLVARVTTAFLNRYLTGQVPAGAAMMQQGNVPGRAALVEGGQPLP